MTEREQIETWIKAGANLKDGVRLFLNLRGNTPAGRIVRRNSDANANLAVRALLKMAGVQPAVRYSPLRGVGGLVPFREQFPFLSDSGCPPELKILAADKITAYRNAITAHRQLIDCKNLAECAAMARTVVDNWIENDACFDELRYYGEMRKVLGKHSVFDEMKRLQELRKSSAKEIFRKQTNLVKKINRLKYEIKKADKPHLLAEREARLRQTEHLLAETDRIIEDL